MYRPSVNMVVNGERIATMLRTCNGEACENRRVQRRENWPTVVSRARRGDALTRMADARQSDRSGAGTTRQGLLRRRHNLLRRFCF